MQAYYANPGELEIIRYRSTSMDLNSYKVNVVCRAKERNSFCSMFTFFSQNPHCLAKMNASSDIQQIVLIDVNEVENRSGKEVVPVLMELNDHP